MNTETNEKHVHPLPGAETPDQSEPISFGLQRVASTSPIRIGDLNPDLYILQCDVMRSCGNKYVVFLADKDGADKYLANEKHVHPLPGAETPKPNDAPSSDPPDNATGSGLHDAACCASDSQILDWLDELVKSGSVFRLWGEGKPGISYYVGGLIPNDFIHANPEDYLFRDIVKHLMVRQKNATHTPSS